MSNSDGRVHFTDYIRKHHPKLVQEFSTTQLPPDELGMWAAFKLVVELDQDGRIASSPDISFVDDRDPDENCGTNKQAIMKFGRVAGSGMLTLATLTSILGGVYYAVDRYVVANWDTALTLLAWAGVIAVLYVVDVVTGQIFIHACDLRQPQSAEARTTFSIPSHQERSKKLA